MVACVLEAYLLLTVFSIGNSESICLLSYLYLTELMLMKYTLPKRQSKTWIKIRGIIQVYVKKMGELIFLLLV